VQPIFNMHSYLSTTAITNLLKQYWATMPMVYYVIENIKFTEYFRCQTYDVKIFSDNP